MITGSILKFSNDVDTDQIIPSQYLLLPTIEEMKQYTFEPLRNDFVKKVSTHNIIIAGENFGCGSSREQAPRVLKELGVQAIVAQSFARIFYRNAINIGLPVIVCKEIYELVSENDQVEIDVQEGYVKIIGNDSVYKSTRLPAYIMNILNNEGLINYINSGY